MYGSKKKSMFMPNDIKENEIQPLLMGDGFHYDQNYNQGFFRTGEFFLILKDNLCFQRDDDEVQIHIIHFNQKTKIFDKKVLTIKAPIHRECGHRVSMLDPLNGKFVYLEKRHLLTNDKEEFAVFIYYINIVDSINENGIDEQMAINVQEPSLKIRYDIDQFNEAHYDVIPFSGEEVETLVVVKAGHKEDPNDYSDDDVNMDNAMPWIISPRSCVDIVHIKGDQISHFKRIIVQFQEMFGFLEWIPSVHYTKEGLLFYKDTGEDQMGNEIISIQQFDLNGKHKFSYIIPAQEKIPYFQPYGNFLFLFPINESIENEHIGCLIKLDEGQVKIIKEFSLDFLFPVFTVKPLFYHLHSHIQRFGYNLLQISSSSREDQMLDNFILLDQESKETIAFLADFKFYQEYSANWNLTEIGTTYFECEDQMEGKKEMYFKVHCSNRSSFLSLRYLACIAVLTTFSKEYLLERNLPSSVIRYLGIRKQ